MAIRLIGEPVTVRDDKARSELGYVGRVSREQGLATLRRPQEHA
jgi:RNase P/RNase MRP subunit p29